MLDDSCPQHMTSSDPGRNRWEDKPQKKPEEEQVQVGQQEKGYSSAAWGVTESRWRRCTAAGRSVDTGAAARSRRRDRSKHKKLDIPDAKACIMHCRYSIPCKDAL